MRPLTQQEIDQAPEWANRYDITKLSSGDLIGYFGKGKMQSVYSREGGCSSDIHSCLRVPGWAKSIPSKQFMAPYKHWCNPIFDDTNDNGYSRYDLIFRKKAIEMARYFNLTIEEIK